MLHDPRQGYRERPRELGDRDAVLAPEPGEYAAASLVDQSRKGSIEVGLCILNHVGKSLVQPTTGVNHERHHAASGAVAAGACQCVCVDAAGGTSERAGASERGVPSDHRPTGTKNIVTGSGRVDSLNIGEP